VESVQSYTTQQGWKMASKKPIGFRFFEKLYKNFKSAKFSFLFFLFLVKFYTDHI